MFTIKQYLSLSGLYKVAQILVFLFISLEVTAQQSTTAPAPPSIWSNPLALTMLAIIFILLLVIALLANVVTGTAHWYRGKQQKNTSATVKTIAGLVAFLLPVMSHAQDAAATTTAAPAPTSIGGLTATTFYLLAAVIAIEFIVILIMGLFVRNFLAKERIHSAAEGALVIKPFRFNNWWEKINSFRPVEQESKIDLGHDYDGIRELDNKLPGWWLYGFYFTIIVGVIYFYRYHIAESAPLSKQEFEIAWKKGEEQKAAFLAKSANNVDENTVTLITDAAALSTAKNTFVQVCSACHGKGGEGGVGPNLTDDYWIHSGGIKDIFKTIKYGWPEKGMKSWKDDYSPIQIAQLASYVKSLHGTNPPNQKEKQGELYVENATAPATDSAANVTKADTTKAK